jgi:hypothetical protein
MIWLLAHPSPVSKVHRRPTRRLSKRDNLLKGEGRGEGMGEEQKYNYTALKESLVLYKSFNTLWV